MLDHLGPISEGVSATVAITLLSFAVGAVVGLALLALVRSRLLAVRLAGRFVIDLLRAVPPIVWLFIIFYGLAEGVVRLEPYPAAVLGLGLVSAAYMAEIYRAGVLGVRPGQWEAAQALGLSRFETVRSVIGPQAFLVVLPGAAAWAVALLKETAVVSIIGVSDITFLATTETQRTGEGLDVFMLAGALYILLSIPLAVLARWTDARVRRAVAH